jgi:hypothetical protein
MEVVPTRTGFMLALQFGQGSGSLPSSTAGAVLAPQWGQYCAPANIEAKHDGQVTVLSADPQ